MAKEDGNVGHQLRGKAHPKCGQSVQQETQVEEENTSQQAQTPLIFSKCLYCRVDSHQ
ncbi:hypothetical protein I79_004670 [Cricetulus griseus]|uniref:Uncharacterized protein n=2 Tax=Cricetulus griseus TaxID=10029 RepID=G3H359_CRIGR|nr:hypothetical protein I79_004670 [Cricetulus griseus]